MEEKPQVENSKEVKKTISKNQLLVIGVVLLLLIAAGVVLVMPKKASTPPASYKASQKPSTPPIPTLPVAFPAEWRIIKTQVYSVTVPTHWEPSVLPFKGGASLILKPNNTAMDPLLVVEAFTSPSSLEEKVNLYKRYNFQRENVTINGNKGAKLTGMRDRRTINKKTILTPTQYRLAYIARPDSIYSVRLYYSSSQPVQIYDDVFEKILGSFTTTNK